MASRKPVRKTLNVDDVLVLISKYSHALSLHRDCSKEKAEACEYVQAILNSHANGDVLIVDKNKWMVLRQLLEVLSLKLYSYSHHLVHSEDEAVAGQVRTALTEDPFVKLFGNFDHILTKSNHDKSRTEILKSSSSRSNSEPKILPSNDSSASAEDKRRMLEDKGKLEAELQEQRRLVRYFQEEVQYKASEIMSLRLALEESARQRHRLSLENQHCLRQLDMDRRNLSQVKAEFDTLQREHVQLVKKLEEERAASKELLCRLEELQTLHQEQQATKELVRQISTRQEEILEEFRDRLPPTDMEEVEALELPPDVREFCDRIQYFIGGHGRTFGQRLLGRHFQVEDFECDPGTCVCFATVHVFWRLVRKWREKADSSALTLEHLQSACSGLTPHPAQLEPMSALKRERLESHFPFLVDHVLVGETLTALRGSGKLSEDARMYVEQGSGRRARVDRLVCVLQSLGDPGFQLFLQALDSSEQFLVSRRLASCLQEENAGEEAHDLSPPDPSTQAAADKVPLVPAPPTDSASPSSPAAPDVIITQHDPHDDAPQVTGSSDVTSDFILKVHELSVACQSVLQVQRGSQVTSSIMASMTSSWEMLRSMELFGSGTE